MPYTCSTHCRDIRTYIVKATRTHYQPPNTVPQFKRELTPSFLLFKQVNHNRLESDPDITRHKKNSRPVSILQGEEEVNKALARDSRHHEQHGYFTKKYNQRDKVPPLPCQKYLTLPSKIERKTEKNKGTVSVRTYLDVQRERCRGRS